MSAIKPCPICGEAELGYQCRQDVFGGESIVVYEHVTCRCGLSCDYRTWQSLPRPKKAPRCPECGSDAVMIYTSALQWYIPRCAICACASSEYETFDLAADAWRPE